MAEASPVSPMPGWTINRGRSRGSAWVWGVAWAGVALVLGLLYSHRPEGQFFYPRCSFHTLSGLWCPGCGGLRSMHELLHGRWAEAVHCNALFVLGTPLALAWWAWRRRCEPGTVTGPRTVWVVFLVVVVFTVLRNLPGTPFQWLAPSP